MKDTDECFPYSHLIIMSYKQCEIVWFGGTKSFMVSSAGQNGRQCDHFTVELRYHVKCVMLLLSSRYYPPDITLEHCSLDVNSVTYLTWMPLLDR